MRILIQRVSHASVTVAGEVKGRIGAGLVLLVGVSPDDDRDILRRMARKVTSLRIFTDDAGKFNLSLQDVGGELLVVSQFTLYANTAKGRRPSFTGAAQGQLAEPLVDQFVEELRSLDVKKVETGVFGAHMDVEIHNNGPVTIWIDSQDLSR